MQLIHQSSIVKKKISGLIWKYSSCAIKKKRGRWLFLSLVLLFIMYLIKKAIILKWMTSSNPVTSIKKHKQNEKKKKETKKTSIGTVSFSSSDGHCWVHQLKFYLFLLCYVNWNLLFITKWWGLYTHKIGIKRKAEIWAHKRYTKSVRTVRTWRAGRVQNRLSSLPLVIYLRVV